MRILLTILAFALFVGRTTAQVSKTVNIATAGTLSSLLTATEKATITNLTLTGKIDARDFETMKSMTQLSVLDMCLVKVVSYNGTGANEIGERAFYGCQSLTSVIIPSSVTSIDSYAFAYCSGLNSVTIPNSVTSIDDWAFSGCSGLNWVTIPNSVTNIGVAAFAYCSGLTSVTIPNSVTDINPGAFAYCRDLTSVIIPSSVKDISINAFTDFRGSFTVDETNTKYSSIDGVLFDKDKTTIIQFPASKTGSYQIPNSVIYIGSETFDGCSGLTSVIIPSSVTYISDGAFSDFRGEFAVDETNKKYSSIDGVLFDKNKTTLIQCPESKTGNYQIPNSVTTIYGGAFSGCSGLTSVTIPNSVTAIPGGAFSGCSGLTSVTIPNSVTAIGWGAFDGCSGLTSLTIPNSVTAINNNAFDGFRGSFTVDARNTNYASIDGVLFNKDKTTLMQCPTSKIGSYQIPNSVKTIADGAFYGCSGLASVSIPNSVTNIGWEAFYGCSGSFTVDETNANYASVDGVLFNKDKTTLMQCPTAKIGSYQIPNSVTNIYGGAFGGCSGLASVTIPNSVTNINWGAFYGCSGAFTVDERNTNYASIDGVLFDKDKTTLMQCPTSKTGSYQIPNSVTNIDRRAFYGCSGLASVTIPNSVTSIAPEAFYGCSGAFTVDETNAYYASIDGVLFNKSKTTLMQCPTSKTGSYQIPNSVKAIDDRAFSGCRGLTSISIAKRTPLAINNTVFDLDSLSSCTLCVPKGSKSLYQNATGWKGFENTLEIISTKTTFAETTTNNWNTVSNWTNGTPDISTEVTVPVGKTLIIDTPNGQCKKLEISPKAQITIDPSKGLTTNEIKISSDATGTASFINKGTLTVNQTISFDRYMTGKRWHLVSSPLSGQNYSSFLATNNVVSTAGDKRGIMEFKPTTDTWGELFSNTTAGSLGGGKAVCMRIDKDTTVTFTGMAQFGNYSPTVVPNKWNLVGNPYLSTIGINNSAATVSTGFINANSENFDANHAAVYIWDESTSTTRYTIVNNASENPIYAQVGQGFFVKPKTGATSIKFTSDMQIHQPTAAFKSANNSWNKITITTAMGAKNCKTDFKFNSDMTLGMDFSYDAGLFPIDPSFLFYSRLIEDNGVNFGLQCLPNDLANETVIPLGLDCKTGGNISISAENFKLPTDYSAVLEDRASGVFTEFIDTSSIYSTTIPANSTGTGRFFLHLKNSNIVTKTNTPTPTVHAHVNNGKLYINCTTQINNVALYDISGRLITNVLPQNSLTDCFDVSNLISGIYLLKLEANGKQEALKVRIW